MTTAWAIEMPSTAWMVAAGLYVLGAVMSWMLFAYYMVRRSERGEPEPSTAQSVVASTVLMMAWPVLPPVAAAIMLVAWIGKGKR